jgi:beta-1,4-mannosyl-glycoprotein beta-1,4-N-acetylglucosaminyltransferase
MDNKSSIIDCFGFYNELDMLEYRLSVLYPYVDAFVLVESTRTFIGTPKPLYYHDNRERYSKYANKIVHVVVDDFWEKPTIGFEFNSSQNQWVNENYQRNAVSFGIEKLVQQGVISDGKDIIMISDLDEIIDPQVIPMIKEYLDKETHPETGGVVGLNMDFYYYHLKCKLEGMYTDKTRVITYERYLELPWLEKSHSKKVRDINHQIRMPSCFLLPQVAGWHMSYFGSEYFIENKIKQFAHQEFNSDYYTNPEIIKKRMEKGEDILGRADYAQIIKRIEFSENEYLPPFPPCPEDVDIWSLFPFCL